MRREPQTPADAVAHETTHWSADRILEELPDVDVDAQASTAIGGSLRPYVAVCRAVQIKLNLVPFRYAVQRRYAMKQTFTAVIKQDGDFWIGWIEEVPGVNCQEATREELLETLRTTLAEALEFNRREARGAAGKGYEELQIAV